MTYPANAHSKEGDVEQMFTATDILLVDCLSCISLNPIEVKIRQDRIYLKSARQCTDNTFNASRTFTTRL